MATEQQIDRIKYLRGNGLSQKDIAEDVGLSPRHGFSNPQGHRFQV